MKMKSFWLSLGLMLIAGYFGLAVENKGDISGIIKDSEGGKPLPGATISLKSGKDGSQTGGAISAKDGRFMIKNIAPGRYILNIAYIGYSDMVIDPVIISPEKLKLDLHEIILKSSSVSLSGVEVVAQKELMETSLDKKIINVDRSIASIGGTATDVMRNIPAVSVDIDGNVSLRGSQNVKILIDGRPSGLTGSTVLEMIPATAIENIEIITNPSAKYDPESTAGIINVVLKKENSYGINGMFNLNAGTGDKYSGSASLNYRYGDFNVYGNYDLRYFSMTGYGRSNQSTTFSDSSLYIRQNEDFYRHGGFNNIKTGADYFIDNFNTLSFSVLFGFGRRNSDEFLKTNQTNSFNQPLDYYTRDNGEKFPNQSVDYTLTYKHNFGKKGHDLIIDGFYSNSTRNINANYAQDAYVYDASNSAFVPTGLPPALQNIATDNKSGTYTLQADYSLPLGPSEKLEAGYKTNVRILDQDYRYEYFDYASSTWKNNTNITNRFKYDEYVHAIYAMYSGKIDEFSFQGGLRAEYADTKSDQVTINQLNTNYYVSFYPSAVLKYEFSKLNSLQLSYSRRINRPSFRQLNAFIDYEDPHNLEGGNPKLQPEYVNSLELGHSLNFDLTSFNTSVFYKKTIDMISEVKTVIDTGVTFTTDMNIASGTSYGVEFVVGQELFKWWRIDANYSYFRTDIAGDNISSDINRSNYSWTAKVNTNLNLFGFLNVQLTGNYEAPTIEAQTIEEENYWAELGIKAEVLDGNASINFRISDIFNTMKHASRSSGLNFSSDAYYKRQSRVAYLGFSYKFNDYKRQREKRRDDGGGEDFGD